MSYTGCAHYKRKATLLAPCCNQYFPCRFCHDQAMYEEAKDPKTAHTLDRHSVVTIKCMLCEKEQGAAQICTGCGATLGAYWCPICVLLDDEDKGQYHCASCGICRVGGRENHTHCDRCGICMKKEAIEGHTCVANAARVDCPVCLESLHASRSPIGFLPCGHSLHRTCLQSFLSSGETQCPLCKRSAMSPEQQDIVILMTDLDIEAAPMPEEYRMKRVQIRCYECRKESITPFHVFGLKCQEESCGSYNTVKLGEAADVTDV
jgi:RING finger/CHY zinc finger protein 1